MVTTSTQSQFVEKRKTEPKAHCWPLQMCSCQNKGTRSGTRSGRSGGIRALSFKGPVRRVQTELSNLFVQQSAVNAEPARSF